MPDLLAHVDDLETLGLDLPEPLTALLGGRVAAGPLGVLLGERYGPIALRRALATVLAVVVSAPPAGSALAGADRGERAPGSEDSRQHRPVSGSGALSYKESALTRAAPIVRGRRTTVPVRVPRWVGDELRRRAALSGRTPEAEAVAVLIERLPQLAADTVAARLAEEPSESAP